MLVKALTALSLLNNLLISTANPSFLVNESNKTLYFSCGLHCYLASFLKERNVLTF